VDSFSGGLTGLGVLNAKMFTIVVLVAVVTSPMAPPMLRWTTARVENTSEEQVREERYDVGQVPGVRPDRRVTIFLFIRFIHCGSFLPD
jgi:hypothetical protein